MTEMERVISLGDLPPSPSREEALAVLLNPNFLGIPVRVIEGVVLAVVTCITALAVHRARNMVRAHAAAETLRTRIQGIFGRYVPAQVVSSSSMRGSLLLSSAMRAYSSPISKASPKLSESLPPDRVIGLLNSLFSAASAVVDEKGGVVVNYVGDALIASFNAPLPVADYRERAVAAARALLSLVSDREFEGHRLRLRIGVATGPVAAGTVGGAERQTYTVYGEQ